MNTAEKISTFSLASLFALRMLGLFMILPIFSIYAQHLQKATPFLIGLTLGSYGLTQAGLQIPLGFLSDRIGRKPVIIAGLGCFIFGSIVAALSTSIYGILIGRALQGSAAIGSVILALLADLTRFSERSQAMAIVGIMIAISFSMAIVLGPILNTWVGMAGIFWLSALLGIIGIFLLYYIVPNPPVLTSQASVGPVWSLLKPVLNNWELLQINIGIFLLHAILTALFMVLPILLTGPLGLNGQQEGWFYLTIISLAFICALYLIKLSKKNQQVNLFLLGSIATVSLSIAGLLLLPLHLISTGILVCLFFTAFTVLEASLPATISKLAPPGSRGTALGVYSTLQFLGIFAGGSIAGYLVNPANHLNQVFIFCIILSIIWFSLAVGMKNPL